MNVDNLSRQEYYSWIRNTAEGREYFKNLMLQKERPYGISTKPK